MGNEPPWQICHGGSYNPKFSARHTDDVAKTRIPKQYGIWIAAKRGGIVHMHIN